LSNIGAQVTLQHLRQSLTQEGPIPPGYRPIKVITAKGETVEGIAKNEDGFSVQLLDYHDKLHWSASGFITYPGAAHCSVCRS
jgi:cytochrome c oxidase cbb3-type subunit III